MSILLLSLPFSRVYIWSVSGYLPGTYPGSRVFIAVENFRAPTAVHHAPTGGPGQVVYKISRVGPVQDGFGSSRVRRSTKNLTGRGRRVSNYHGSGRVTLTPLDPTRPASFQLSREQRWKIATDLIAQLASGENSPPTQNADEPDQIRPDPTREFSPDALTTSGNTNGLECTT